MTDTSAELLARFQRGEEAAATEMFQRYVERLTLLARSRLSAKLASRTDPEDVVLSAYRSFFMGARSGRFSLERSGDLWRLLVSITLHKLYRQANHHTAAKRSVDAEQKPSSEQAWVDGAVSREDAPEAAIALADELESLMASFDAATRRVLELRLQGETIEEIATDTARSERTVRRTLHSIRERLATRLGADGHE